MPDSADGSGDASAAEPVGVDGFVQLPPLALVEANETAPDRCVIYSTDSAETIHGTWIAATGDSFVALPETR